MEETVMAAESQPEEATARPEAESIRIPVKFNKEIRELTAKEATDYAQKGMKYEQIRPEFERLRTLAKSCNQTVPELLERLCNENRADRLAALTERCGGDAAFAAHVLALEEAAEPADGSFAELKEMFPEFSTPEKVPAEVLSAAEQKGTRLLDEYLRYRLQQSRARKAAEADRKAADFQAVGSQKHYAAESNPVQMEFLRGIWENNPRLRTAQSP